MTKKDFQLIARVVANLSDGPVSEVQIEGLSAAEQRMVAERFATALAPTNLLFKRDLFIQAATGQVAVTARKARQTAVRGSSMTGRSGMSNWPTASRSRPPRVRSTSRRGRK